MQMRMSHSHGRSSGNGVRKETAAAVWNGDLGDMVSTTTVCRPGGPRIGLAIHENGLFELATSAATGAATKLFKPRSKHGLALYVITHGLPTVTVYSEGELEFQSLDVIQPAPRDVVIEYDGALHYDSWVARSRGTTRPASDDGGGATDPPHHHPKRGGNGETDGRSRCIAHTRGGRL